MTKSKVTPRPESVETGPVEQIRPGGGLAALVSIPNPVGIGDTSEVPEVLKVGIAGLFVDAYDAVLRMRELSARYGQLNLAVIALSGGEDDPESERVNRVIEEVGLGAVREVLTCIAQDLAAAGVSSRRDKQRMLGRAYNLWPEGAAHPIDFGPVRDQEALNALNAVNAGG
jgi:hypothetical protein